MIYFTNCHSVIHSFLSYLTNGVVVWTSPLEQEIWGWCSGIDFTSGAGDMGMV